MPSFFSRFVRIGRLPEPLRAQLAPKGILQVAERVRVTQPDYVFHMLGVRVRP